VATCIHRDPNYVIIYLNLLCLVWDYNWSHSCIGSHKNGTMTNQPDQTWLVWKLRDIQSGFAAN